MGFKGTHTEEYINKFFIIRTIFEKWDEWKRWHIQWLYVYAAVRQRKEVFCGIQFVFQKLLSLFEMCRHTVNWEVELNIL